MFDIGFAELLLIGVVGLLVIGPERLPSTIRTVSAWLAQIRRGFNQIRSEVEQELHNDAIMQELRKTGSDLKRDAQQAGDALKAAGGNDSAAASASTEDSSAANPGRPGQVSPDKEPSGQ
ncbi:Sec-independent protein translocase protein TatB [Haliea sp.]|jgi:sec-independent protein translocase protein TatB|uniref:Sec-independent protein translocase protein TatB n=1 Tax=Haliea sp. TaxID=1932666 RepID=UPI0035284B91